MPKVAVAVLLALASLALGCGSACQDLADRVCFCLPAGTQRNSCTSSVKNQVGNGTQRPTGADQDFCRQKLLTCPDTEHQPWLCPLLQSEWGKEACGLSFPADTGTSG